MIQIAFYDYFPQPDFFGDGGDNGDYYWLLGCVLR
jgi:hypothetical protein